MLTRQLKQHSRETGSRRLLTVQTQTRWAHPHCRSIGSMQNHVNTINSDLVLSVNPEFPDLGHLAPTYMAH